MSYQDHWVNGRTVKRGMRECFGRYRVIREICAPIAASQKTFTVCDIGANACYFGLRLTEDFPNCSVLAFEFSKPTIAEELIRRNKKQGRVLLCRQKLTLASAEALCGLTRFDVVLALSVLHHVKPFDAWVETLKRLGKRVIAELAIDDSRSKIDHKSKLTGTVIGHGQSHIKKGHLRPIVLIEGSL